LHLVTSGNTSSAANIRTIDHASVTRPSIELAIEPSEARDNWTFPLHSPNLFKSQGYRIIATYSGWLHSRPKGAGKFIASFYRIAIQNVLPSIHASSTIHNTPLVTCILYIHGISRTIDHIQYIAIYYCYIQTLHSSQYWTAAAAAAPNLLIRWKWPVGNPILRHLTAPFDGIVYKRSLGFFQNPPHGWAVTAPMHGRGPLLH